MLEVDSSGVIHATGNLDKFTDATKKAQAEVTKAEKGFNNLSDVIHGIGSNLAVAFASFKALSGALSGFTGFLRKTIATSAQYEGLLVNLSVVLGDATKAQKEFNAIREMASKTPFSADGLTAVATQLHAVGLESKEAMNMLTKFATVAMGDNDKLQRMALNYAQIVSVGKASSIDMKQFAQMGLPVYQYMKEMQIQGQATAEDVKKMFEMMTSEGGKFFGGIEKGASTANASLNAVRDNFQALSASIGDQFQPALKTLYGIASRILALATDNPIVTGALMSAVTALGLALAGSLVAGARAGIVALKTLATQATITGGILTAMSSAIPVIGIISTVLSVAVGGYTAISTAMKNAKEDAENQTIALAEQNQELREFIDLADKIAVKNAQRHGKNGNATEVENIALLELELQNIEDELRGFDTMFKNLLSQGYSLDEATRIFNKNNKKLVDDLVLRRTELMKEIDTRKQAVEATNRELELQERLTKEIEKASEAYKAIQSSIAEAYSKTQKGQISQLQSTYDYYSSLLDNPVIYSNERGDIVQLSEDEIAQIEELQAKAKADLDDAIHKMKLYALSEGQEWRKQWLEILGMTNEQFYAITGQYLSDASADAMLNAYMEVSDPDSLRNKLLDKTGNTDLVDQLLPKESIEERIEYLSSKLESLKLTKVNAILDGFYNGWDFNDRESNRGKDGLYRANQLEDTISSAEAELNALTAELEIANSLAKENGYVLFGGASYMDRLSESRDRLTESFNNTDVGTAISDFQKGGIIDALNGGMADFLVSLTGSILELDSVKKILNPIGTILSSMMSILEPLISDALSPIIDILSVIGESLATILSPVITVVSVGLRALSGLLNIVLEPLRLVGEVFKWLNDEVIVPVGNAFINIINGVIKALNTIPLVSIPLIDNLEKMDDVVSDFNKDARDLTAQYEKLLSAMREQENYYLTKKQALVGKNATDILMGVNDMILTPNGNFSTHPDDYIIATKNPQSLGGATVNVQINNTVSNDVNADVEQRIDANGVAQLFVTISRKIASDVAKGANGWDSAMRAQGKRLAGRSF